MKVLVCGGRDYDDGQRLYAVLDIQHGKTPITLLIHGAAKGADMLADSWADSRGVQPVACRALWEFYRNIGRLKEAGGVRNAAMLLLKPELIIAFPGGGGTENMIRQAKLAGIPGRKIK